MGYFLPAQLSLSCTAPLLMSLCCIFIALPSFHSTTNNMSLQFIISQGFLCPLWCIFSSWSGGLCGPLRKIIYNLCFHGCWAEAAIHKRLHFIEHWPHTRKVFWVQIWIPPVSSRYFLKDLYIGGYLSLFKCKPNSINTYLEKCTRAHFNSIYAGYPYIIDNLYVE